MPRGSSPKREREFTKLTKEFKKEHRYPGREEEVAARIVNKQRREKGETKGASSSSSKSGSSRGRAASRSGSASRAKGRSRSSK